MPSPSATAPATPLLDILVSADRAVRENALADARRYYERVLSLDPASLDAKVGLDYLEYLESGKRSRYRWKSSEVPEEQKRAREANKELMLWEFENRKKRLRSMPAAVFLEHTTRCNFYCPHCLKGYEPYPAQDMSEDMTLQALDSILPSLTWACITGFGEPTIGSRYHRIMEKLVENDVTVHYSTNTSTLTVPHIETLVRIGAKILLSIDGASRETFESIRQGGSWEKLQYVLHAIRRLRSILGGDSVFGVTFVAMKMNVHELPAMVRMVHEFGLDCLKIHDYQTIGKDFDEQSLRDDAKRANAYFDEAEKLAEQLGVDFIAPPRYVTTQPPGSGTGWRKFLLTGRLFPERHRFPQRCILPWRFVQIGVYGEVTPCCYSMRVMGHLDKQPLRKIWNNWKYLLFRWRVDSFYPPPECRECHVYEGINKGNPGNTMSREGFLLRLAYKLERRLSGLWKQFLAKFDKPPAAPMYFKGKHFREDSPPKK